MLSMTRVSVNSFLGMVASQNGHCAMLSTMAVDSREAAA